MNQMSYTNSSLISYTKISPNRTSPRNHVIDTITIHCMAGNMTLEACGNLFANPAAQASSNYGIDSNGKVAMYVEEKDRSWCSSNAANDNRAITIEVANDGGANTGWHVSDKAMASLITLIADICKRNNIKELKWKADKSLIGQVDKQNMTVHRWFSAKSCPGDYLYNKYPYIVKEVNKKLGIDSNPATPTNPTTPEKPTVPTKPTTPNKPTTPAKYTQIDFIKDVQKAIGAKVDGIAGNETLAKTVTVSMSINNTHKVVLPIQKYLNSLTFNCGTADGIAGPIFDNAVKKFQQSNSCISDGEITAGEKTWKVLLGLLY